MPACKLYWQIHLYWLWNIYLHIWLVNFTKGDKQTQIYSYYIDLKYMNIFNIYLRYFMAHVPGTMWYYYKFGKFHRIYNFFKPSLKWQISHRLYLLRLEVQKRTSPMGAWKWHPNILVFTSPSRKLANCLEVGYYAQAWWFVGLNCLGAMHHGLRITVIKKWQ